MTVASSNHRSDVTIQQYSNGLLSCSCYTCRQGCFLLLNGSSSGSAASFSTVLQQGNTQRSTHLRTTQHNVMWGLLTGCCVYLLTQRYVLLHTGLTTSLRVKHMLGLPLAQMHPLRRLPAQTASLALQVATLQALIPPANHGECPQTPVVPGLCMNARTLCIGSKAVSTPSACNCSSVSCCRRILSCCSCVCTQSPSIWPFSVN